MNFGEGPGGAPGRAPGSACPGQGTAPTGADEGIRIIQSALDAGITAVDSDDVYSQGESVLDAIDELVPPGTNFVERDAGAIVPSLEYAELRRR